MGGFGGRPELPLAATKKIPWSPQNVTYSLVDAPPRCPERRLGARGFCAVSADRSAQIVRSGG
jgi:hypothetical protein